MRILRLYFVLLFAFFTMVFLCSCGSSKKKDNVLRYWLKQDPPSLDPARATDTTSAVVLMHILDGLVELDSLTLEPVPAVAERWEISDDGLVYTFYLRKGVKFHNGREVIASDFKYSFERILDPETGAVTFWVLEPIAGAMAKLRGEADSVEGIRVIDDYTLEITIEESLSFFLVQLSMEAANVIPREEVEKLGKDFGLRPVGCGPFRFVSWDRDSRVVLEAFDDYYGEGPYVDGIRFLIHQDKSQAFELYKAGEIDILTDLPLNRVRSTERDFPNDFMRWDILGTYYICFNHESEPFKNNRALRQAFNYAVDRESICKILLEGVPYPAKGILPKGMMAYNPDLEGYTYDLDKARELLDEAGYAGGRGLDIELWYNSDEQHKNICVLIQDSLRQLGINVRLNTMEWGPYLDAIRDGKISLFRIGWLADFSDPDNFLNILLHSSRIGETNYSRYNNPEFDSLVEKARHLLDPEERKTLYMKAEQLAVDDATWLFIYHYGDYLLRKPYVKGIITPLQGDFRIPLEKVKIER